MRILSRHIRCAVVMFLMMVLAFACPAVAFAQAEASAQGVDVGYTIYDVTAAGRIAADAESLSVSISGENLPNGFTAVLLYQNNSISQSVTVGSMTEQSAVLAVPGNIAHRSEAYEIQIMDPYGNYTGRSQTLIVSAVEDVIYTDNMVQIVESSGGTVDLLINSNFSWQVLNVSGAWLTTANGGPMGTTTLRLYAEENTGDYRVARVTLLTDGELNAYTVIQVEQRGANDPYSASQLMSDDNGISVSGVLHSDATLTLKPLASDSEMFQAFSGMSQSQEIYCAFDASLAIDEDTLPNRGAVEVFISVDPVYNGKQCEVLYIDPSGEMNSQVTTVSGGKAIVSVDSLSPMVLLLPSAVIETSGDKQSADTESSWRRILKPVLYALLIVFALTALLTAFVLLTTRRTLKTMDGSVSFYIGTIELPATLGKIIGWIWKAAAETTLTVKGWFGAGK